VAERHVETRAGRGDFHVRGDHRLAATDRGPHRLAEHGVNAGTVVLHLAVDSDDRALAIRDGRPDIRRPPIPGELRLPTPLRWIFIRRSSTVTAAYPSTQSLPTTTPRVSGGWLADYAVALQKKRARLTLPRNSRIDVLVYGPVSRRITTSSVGHGGPFRTVLTSSCPTHRPFGNWSPASQRHAVTIARTSPRHSPSSFRSAPR
jgi:hypothetical protein